MNKNIAVAIIATIAFCTFAAPSLAASKFWVVNDSDYEVLHVYATSDSSGGNRDLMGENGWIPPWDRAQVLRPRGNACWSDVAVVNEHNQWLWYRDVDICDPRTTIRVQNRHFN